MAGDLRTRAVLAPAMLLAIGLVFWLDLDRVVVDRQGALAAVVLAVLGLAGAQEYAAMMRGAGFAIARTPLLLAAAALHGLAFPMGWHQLDRELYPLVALTLLLLFPLALRSLRSENMNQGLEQQGATLLGFIFISWPVYLAQGICFRHLQSLLFVVLVCKGGDIGGYLTGRLLGRRKLIPHISPGKTVAGALGSGVWSVALAMLLAPVLVEDLALGLTGAAAVGIILNFTTQTGDLIESLLKRRCGAKDSSRLLPAHGGVLDLIDSLLFSFAVWFPLLVWLT
jgi:phosphatidate cytidylyltransferase